MALRLDTHIQYIKGVGPKLGDLFSRKGIKTVGDLLEFYPRSFEDQRAARNISSLRAEDIVSIKATIVNVHSINMGRSSRKIYDVLVRDSSGQIHCKYFRVPYRGYFERFKPFTEVRVVGKVTEYRGRLEFHHPDIRDIEPDEENQDALIPLYTEIEGLASNKIQKLIQSAIRQIEEWPEESYPAWIREKYKLIPRQDALKEMHNPIPAKAAEYFSFQSSAQRRIIFDEFFWLELYLASRKTGFKKDQAPQVKNQGEGLRKLLQSLPFEMTGAQKKVFAEIKADLEKNSPMHRMVQGDVGSGKTLVSFMAAIYAIESGFQSCLMAPTEILAEQHYKNAQKILEPLGIRLGVLLGKSKASERKVVLEKLANGEIDLIVGTHALLEDEVQFSNLGLVIIDEQHRFGVEQRGYLKNKGKSPHFFNYDSDTNSKNISDDCLWRLRCFYY